MKYFLNLFALFTSMFSFGQASEDIIPRDAVSVFSINNVSLLKKVSMDDLVKYEFMAEVQSELFNGSTNGKTIKDLGLDFNQKLNAFYGQNEQYELSGFTFGINDKKQLFTVFDDFDKIENTKLEGVEFYRSYSNYLIIRGTSGIVIRVDPNTENVATIADSIWLARGLGYFWDSQSVEEDYDDEEYYTDTEEESESSDSVAYSINDDEVNLEEESVEGDLYANDLLSKNYWEMRDSINFSLQEVYLRKITLEIFRDNVHLKNQDSKFATQLQRPSDGVFYLDNSRNLHNSKGLWGFKAMFPELFDDFKNIYSDNIMLGDINLNEHSIDIDFVANYGKDLGSIYEKLNSTKFDKNVLKYIHKDNTGFFTYNIDLNEGYKKAFDIVIPILKDEKDPRISSNVLVAELINEFVNTEEVFKTYKGSMFGAFNGYKKVKTKRIEFLYDEETFDYEEKEVESEEDMPIFTIGFSTSRPDIPEKVLKHFGRMTSRFKNHGNYWEIEDAVLNSISAYIISKNGLFMITNDEDLAKNHSNGYGSKAISGKVAKKAKASKFVYGYFDWSGALEKLPREMFTTKQNNILDAMKGKTGVLELTSSKTTVANTKFKLTYDFDGTFDNSGKYLLDLVNSIYVLTK
jgi:hypothetical protein